MEDPTPEIWLPIPGWERGYEVSNLGRIKSIERITYDKHGMPHRTLPRIMKLRDVSGYRRVFLTLGNKRKTVAVHRMVALAFLGAGPEGYDVCHNDGDRSNNRIENLRYDTRKGNVADRVEHGTEHRLTWTHCPHGHEYTPDNILDKDGTRRCLTCHRCRARETHRRRKGYYERRGLPVPKFEDVIKDYKPARPIKYRGLKK